MEQDQDLKLRRRKRKKLLDALRRQGNHIFNSDTVFNENYILPDRRPVGKRLVVDRHKYVTCVHCAGTFVKRTFYKHMAKYHPLNNVSSKTENSLRKGVLKEHSINIMPQAEASKLLKDKIFDVIQKDQIGLEALKDRLILQMASQFLSSHRERKDEYNITKKMRDAARLLLFCKEKDSTIKEFSDLLQPMYFELVMQAVQALSGYNEETATVKVVGMPARLSFVIIESAKILPDQAILSRTMSNSEKECIKVTVQEFLQVFRNQFKHYISSNAEKTRKKGVSTRPEVVPEDTDIKTLFGKINELQTVAFDTLQSAVTPRNYEDLCKATITQIILFNRRRPGEVVNSELFHYVNRAPAESLSKDVLEALSPEEVNA